MTKTLLRQRALELRKLGKSYSQIKKELRVSKSILSTWLHKYPLNKNQIRLLRDISEVRIEKYRETMRLKREKRLNNYYKEAKKLLPLSGKELLLAGIFLYWGEGSKTEPGLVSVSNTDPRVLTFVLRWMYDALKVPKEKIRVLLHVYKDMDIQQIITYWSNELKIDKKQFIKPYVKESNRIGLTEKGYGYGTCNIRITDTVFKQKIMMTIKAVSDCYQS